MKVPRKTILATFLVLVLAALPVWWKTTQTYRAVLPHKQIESLQWEEYGDSIQVDVIALSSQNTPQSVLQALENNLEKNLREVPKTHNVRVSVTSKLADLSDKTQRAISEWDSWLEGHCSSRSNGRYCLFMVVGGKKGAAGGGSFGSKRHGWMVLEDVNSLALESVASSAVKLLRSTVLSGNSSPSTQLSQAVTVSAATRYTLCFTLLNANPSTQRLAWDFESEFEAHLRPFLDALAPLARFAVLSQVLHYGELAKNPIWNSNGTYYHIPEQELPLYINPHQWGLDLTDTSSAEPVVNLILYVPDKGNSPLFIRNAAGSKLSAFVAPQWGGIVIHNPASESPDMREAMRSFAGQIRQLFGLSPLPLPGTVPSPTGIAEWEVDIVARSYLSSNLKSAINTLRSMSSLIENLSNMMVGDHIAELASEAVSSIEEAEEAIEMSDYDSALASSRNAVERAEKAFFDPQMLALLYFPDEHKLAIYALPFLPLLFQLTSGVWAQIKERRK